MVYVPPLAGVPFENVPLPTTDEPLLPFPLLVVVEVLELLDFLLLPQPAARTARATTTAASSP
jgi:hypothetical protein